jgi:hypothetical protein
MFEENNDIAKSYSQNFLQVKILIDKTWLYLTNNQYIVL